MSLLEQKGPVWTTLQRLHPFPWVRRSAQSHLDSGDLGALLCAASVHLGPSEVSLGFDASWTGRLCKGLSTHTSGVYPSVPLLIMFLFITWLHRCAPGFCTDFLLKSSISHGTLNLFVDFFTTVWCVASITFNLSQILLVLTLHLSCNWQMGPSHRLLWYLTCSHHSESNSSLTRTVWESLFIFLRYSTKRSCQTKKSLFLSVKMVFKPVPQGAPNTASITTAVSDHPPCWPHSHWMPLTLPWPLSSAPRDSGLESFRKGLNEKGKQSKRGQLNIFP